MRPTNSKPYVPVPTSFHWTHGGQEVYLVGTFTGWKDRIKMGKESDFIFSYVLDLAPGIHSYKFIVDGEWKFCPDQEQIVDCNGNVNNCISVTQSIVPASIPSDWSPSVQRKKREQPPKSILHNQLLLPGVQEITRFGKEISNPHNINRKLKTNISSDSLITYVHAGEINRHKLLLVMVGLPARGKSFISRKLARYLNWLGYNCKVFNLGNYRRSKLGSFHSHDWFSPGNNEGTNARQEMAKDALEDVVNWYRNSSGSIAIFDGTNSTYERRQFLVNSLKNLKPQFHVKAIFVEVLCSDPEVIFNNILGKMSSPDYVGIPKQQVIDDFKERIKHYESAYQTLSKHEDYRYIKTFDVGRQIVANRITGFLPGKVMFYLSNLHIIPRPIYLVRHGQSQYNVEDRVGGDSALTEEGVQFSIKLRKFMESEVSNCESTLCVWSSTMIRAVQTAQNIPCAQYIRWKSMDEIQVGVCDGMTYEEIQDKYPEEFLARQKDKLRYRYPRGESYEDVIRRVEPVLMELERQREPILIVAHRAVLRCLYAYFAYDNKTREEVPYINFPLNQVVRLTPTAYGTQEKLFTL